MLAPVIKHFQAIYPQSLKTARFQYRFFSWCALLTICRWKIANHHGAFNQSVGNEVRSFVQTVPLFVTFAFGDALVDLTEVNIPP